MTAWNQLIEEAVALGAFKAGVIPVSAVSFDRSFRDICETNACGKCGRCWMCPPDIGDIDVLMEQARGYDYLVFCTQDDASRAFLESLGLDPNAGFADLRYQW